MVSIFVYREVDSALRPGAFALLDACSGNDLQQLHAALGGNFSDSWCGHGSKIRCSRKLCAESI